MIPHYRCKRDNGDAHESSLDDSGRAAVGQRVERDVHLCVGLEVRVGLTRHEQAVGEKRNAVARDSEALEALKPFLDKLGGGMPLRLLGRCV